MNSVNSNSLWNKNDIMRVNHYPLRNKTNLDKTTYSEIQQVEMGYVQPEALPQELH